MKENRFSLLKNIKLFVIGYLMGAANVIPGVSGGTVAFVSGIYEELILSIKNLASLDMLKKIFNFQVKGFFDSIIFLSSIGLGTLFAFATLAKFITWLLDNYQVYTYSVFLGLILGSIFIVSKMIKSWNFLSILALLCGTFFAYIIVNMIPYETPNEWWISFLCGIIAIIAMILPGISGSFLLLILGQYKYVWGAISNISRFQFSIADISTCFWIGVGAVIGLGVFSHFLNWLFRKYHDLTIALLSGFMIGSLWRLWPWQRTVVFSAKIANQVLRIDINSDGIKKFEELRSAGAKFKALVNENFLPKQLDFSVILAIVLVFTGIIFVVLFEMMAIKKKKE
ncbi:MAG TPA: DUF368 domain-containing protein [Victivallales bacterium]|nr:DUF368 domain-containing protein [Victivallales bacterium]HRU00725.1 DUF368 domain-containing protein [Victivallales bacterium]